MNSSALTGISAPIFTEADLEELRFLMGITTSPTLRPSSAQSAETSGREHTLHLQKPSGSADTPPALPAEAEYSLPDGTKILTDQLPLTSWPEK